MNYSLQIAGGIAAIIVSFHHLFLGPFFKMHPDSFLKSTHINLLGGLAVYFFFALSGYVLTLSINKKQITSIKFIKDRVLRIYPEYIIWTLLAYGSWIIFGGEWMNLNYIPKNIMDWVHTLTLIPPLFHSDTFAMLLSVAWSLVYEMYFYVLFSVLLFFVKDKQKYINISLIMLFIFFISHTLIRGNFDVERYRWVYWPYMLSDFISLTFALGSFLFYQKSLKFRSNLVPLVLITVLLLVLIFSKKNLAASHNLVLFSIIILYLTLSIEVTSEFWKKLIFLGDASYTIYLIHVIFSKVAWKIDNGFILFLFNILVIIVGCLLYKYVSKPISNWIKTKC